MSTAEPSQLQVYDPAGRRKYLNSDERSRFLAEADLLPPPRRALCYVLAYSGCRVSEALALTRCHLDTEQMSLCFKTLKRRKLVFRTVPIPKALTAMLFDLSSREDEPLWRMHRSTAWRIVTGAMQRADITGPMACCKGLRHGFCIRAVGQNVPVNLVQRWAGHASQTTTAIYLDAIGLEERAFAQRMW